jgi:hypothetical protein
MGPTDPKQHTSDPDFAAVFCWVRVCRWVEVSGRSTEDVLEEVLSELDKPQHQGGCGDSGRFDKAAQNALKRYVPRLKLYSDPDRVAATLKWVQEAAAAACAKQQGGGRAVESAAAAAAAAAAAGAGPSCGSGQDQCN